ncbi:MAG: hypothetical protein A2161_12965 [Candidatus Schekmanbacteria bacterium RBG_13_48_7]|uniref:UPF0235 protein A2161_12965 n=1 Tax=Candidatus Schekmanbacteria bacterium RBG_13_48_7 TaxID=1817878 RepID=A0A1F7RWD0_9BACT|nr:MAG: hypothetical protein A2161_12965 [Candidatus Schekmanbacteria bacterium RBG_13_48_7]
MINVKVIPKSSKSEVAGVQNGFLKLKLCSPPEKGKANAECQRLLAGIFDLAKNQIMLVSGEKKQQKTFLIDNVDEPGFLESINRCINH